MDIKKDILWRVYLCFLGMVLLGIVVVARAFYIQQAEGKYWTNLGDSMHLRYLPIDAERGTIYSEDGNMLSTSVPVFDIYIDFAAEGLREKNGERFTKNIDSLSICLANLFKDKTAAAYKKELQLGYRNKERYHSLRKKVSFSDYQQFRDFPLVKLGKNKSGFIVETKDKRINPYVLLANRTIGLSRNNASNVGLEQSYDSLLKGKTGQQLVRYVAGTYLPVDGGEVEPENGKDIISTLDTYIQDVTESALMNMLVRNNSLHGTAIVMETATGKIKAIANLGKQRDSVYTEDLNYGIGKATEPGSVFKLATLMSLLEDKYVDINSIVDCEGGQKRFYGLPIRDSHLGDGAITVKDAFAKSSNVAFAKLADQYYHEQPAKFLEHLHRFRLDQMTGVDITASSGRPLIKKPTSRSWSKTTIPFMAHGYEELVTPLHMLMLYNAVANDGRMMKPYLVSAIREYGVEVRKIEPQVLVEKICSDQTLKQVKECMLEVVNNPHGTARKLKDSSYQIAGKTGTAVTALNNKGYNKGNKIYQASFIGYFPAEQPRYTIAVVIQNSRESRMVYGADVSGAVFKEISDRIYGSYLSTRKFTVNPKADSTAYYYHGAKDEFVSVLNYLNMPFMDSASNGYWRYAQVQNNKGLLKLKNETAAATIPDATGMGLKDAVYLLENAGLKVTATGRGKVISQSLLPGMPLNKSQTINLVLN
ncbi:MAG TPA: penicillin-binding protein [Ferruginibacter sp.]|nr:penicillin-binding protein [Ferruginibacter sp.]HNA00342.1 penicillin-binding protein [Ferruginibacter sp.]HNA16949.1 penicillin-binding protein [Ferruginibacter sp.]HNF43085.1 penicillin-binding protein [Ferruginibacter sp.]HNG62618.1 penicillin-binding protein [Ferruginibacter sp.]